MRIIELDRKGFEGRTVLFSYDSFGIWKAVPTAEEGAMGTVFRYEKAPRTHHEIEQPFFQDYLPDSIVYALYDENEMRGFIEVAREWSGRLRVGGLNVFEGYRRRGYGSLLFTKAREAARRLKCRGIVLETQSCNSGAIAFYLRQGLRFTGCDLTCYSNSDIENNEVRIEMGMTL